MFIVSITSVTGGAVLSEPTNANITILSNDFPVTLSPSKIIVNEGEKVRLHVNVPISLTHDVNATLQINATTASYDDFSLSVRMVVIRAGTKSTTIEVLIVDDVQPELMECFKIFAVSTTGNTVLYGNTTSEICIAPNDDAGGVFVFSTQEIKDKKEGDNVNIR